MCGIFVALANRANIDDCARKVDQGLFFQSFRGPDNQSRQTYPIDSSNSIIFGHNRLSIIDLSSSSNQPVESSDSNYILVFNGEIYNYLELASTFNLSERAMHSDTWCLLELISLLGIPEAIKRLRGMWALAIYCQMSKKLYIHRDDAGIKPLFWHKNNLGLFISSDLIAVQQLFSNPINHEEVTAFLCGSEHCRESTYYENVRRFMPGYLYTFNSNGVLELKSRLSSYYDYQLPPSFNERIELYGHLFSQSVDRHLVSDTSYAIALSGGLDSSSIYACIKSSKKELSDSITVQFSEEEFTEIEIIRKYCDSNLFILSPSPTEFWADFEKWHKLYHAPLPSSSVYAQFCVARRAKELGHKILLSGQGADELLAGYRYHSKSKSFVHRYIKALFKKPVVSNSYLNMLSEPVRTQYLYRLNQQAYSYNLHHSTLRSFDYRSLPKLLYQEDMSSMANSIENRVPFLDQDLVSYIRSLPDTDLRHKGVSKFIHRKSFESLLPPCIISDRNKRGFPTPESNWISYNQVYVKNRIFDALELLEPYFNIESLRRFLVTSSFSEGSNYKSYVWKVFSLATWLTQ